MQTINYAYENLREFNPTKKRKVLIVFDDMIEDMKANKKLSPTVTEFFMRENSTFHLFLYHNLISKCLKILRLNTTH